MKLTIKRVVLAVTALLCSALLVACSDDGEVNYAGEAGYYDEASDCGEDCTCDHIAIAAPTNLQITPEMLTHSDFTAVTLEIVEGTLTTTGARFALRNNTDYEMDYGEAFQLRVWNGTRWAHIPLIDSPASFDGHAMLLAPHETQLIYRNWGRIFGELAPGIYRFRTPVGNRDVRGELEVVFVIEYGQQSDPHSPYANIYNIRMWHPETTGRSVARITQWTRGSTVGYQSGWTQRATMLHSRAPSDLTITISGFECDDEHVNVAVYIVRMDGWETVYEQRLGYRQEIGQDGRFNFFLPRSEMGNMLVVLINTSHPTFEGMIYVDIEHTHLVRYPLFLDYNFAGITMTAVAVSPRQVSFLMANPSEYTAYYFPEFRLFHWVDDAWLYLESVSCFWAVSIAPDETKLRTLALPHLQDGTYRFFVEFYDTPFYMATLCLFSNAIWRY